MNGCQGDGFSSMGARKGAIKLAMADTQEIDGANFLQCWIANSICLECAESLMTK